MQDGFRRLYVCVESTKLNPASATASNLLSVSVSAGDGVKAESEALPSAVEVAWDWSAEVAPRPGCTHAIFAVSRRKVLGFLGAEVLGSVSIPFASALGDQVEHAFQLPLVAPGSNENVGEMALRLRYADYEALRQFLVEDTSGASDSAPPAPAQPSADPQPRPHHPPAAQEPLPSRESAPARAEAGRDTACRLLCKAVSKSMR